MEANYLNVFSKPNSDFYLDYDFLFSFYSSCKCNATVTKTLTLKKLLP